MLKIKASKFDWLVLGIKVHVICHLIQCILSHIIEMRGRNNQGIY